MITLCVVIITTGAQVAKAADYPFEHIWRPSLWYNTIDGVQVGARYFGYQDSPNIDRYRFYTGLWLNTSLPKYPVAYDFRFEHPLIGTGAIPEPLTFGIQSRFRDGLHRHGGFLEKRFQTGGYYDQFLTLRGSATFHHQIDNRYLVFPSNWQTDAGTVFNVSAYLRDGNENRYITAWADVKTTTSHDDLIFEAGTSYHNQISRHVALGVKIGTRFHSQESGNPALSTNLAYQPSLYWHDNSFFRSHGSLPVAALRSGSFVTTGSMPSMRGYARHDTRRFQTSDIHAISALQGVSADLEIANPLDLYLREVPIAGIFIHLKTRLFADAAVVQYNDTAQITTNNVIANAGAGLLFYMNIPDVLAKERGFALRWDIPFWLSDPLDAEKAFKFRQQLSFDIIIPF